MPDRARQADGELAARGRVAEQHVGDRQPGFLAERPALDERGRGGDIDERERPRAEDEHDDRDAERAQGLEQCGLAADQREVRAVDAELRVPRFACGVLVVADAQHDRVRAGDGRDRLGDQTPVFGGIGGGGFLEGDALIGDLFGFGRRDACAERIGDRCRAELGAQAFEHADLAARGARVAAEEHRVGERTDDREPARARAVKRQHAVVLEQDDRALGRASGERARIGRVGDRDRARGVAWRLLEQSREKLDAQHARDRAVDRPYRHATGADRGDQRRIIGEVGRLDIDPRHQRAGRRVGRVGSDVLRVDELADTVVIAHDEALKADLLAQHLGQQPVARVVGHAADLVVRCHDAHRVAAPDHARERADVDIAQRALGQVDRPGVAAALGLAVPGEMLERRAHAVGAERQRIALEAAHRREPDLAVQIRVLAEGLVGAAPARLAHHVEHRGEHDADAARTRLARGNREGLAHEFGIPGARERRRRGKGRAVAAVDAVRRLLLDEHGDAQSRAMSRVRLDGVGERDEFGDRLGRRARRRGGDVIAQVRDVADAVRERARRRLGHEAVRVIDHAHCVQLRQPQTAELRDLLFERHAPEQVGDALPDWRGGIAVAGQ